MTWESPEPSMAICLGTIRKSDLVRVEENSKNKDEEQGA